MKYPNPRFNPKPCRTCGESFTPTAPSHLYCSSECRGTNSYLRRNYGITDAQRGAMEDSQDGRCAICLREGFLMHETHTKKLNVDHCHDSGKVRMLLCHNCNRALGLLNDDVETILRAAAYVEFHREGATTIPFGSRPKRAEAHSPSENRG
jgi:hypothetical protein